jgi:hypothetical protein
MPFSPQPRKKGSSGPQDANKKKASCGHVSPLKDCPECNKQVDNVIDLPTEKKKIAVLQEKLAHKFMTDAEAPRKAAQILAQWINDTKKKK